jgi:biopolymer transport protein ExbD
LHTFIKIETTISTNQKPTAMNLDKSYANRIQGKIRSRKINPKIDLTAMVSISFLLIGFFMISSELRRPQAMGLSLSSEKSCGEYQGCNMEDRTYTILLGDDDKIVSYRGLLIAPLSNPYEFKYGRNGIRKELLKQNNKMKDYSAHIGKPNRGIIVIIKPSKKSNFKNLVDILDEMEIVGIPTYTIINEFTPEEAKLLKGNRM